MATIAGNRWRWRCSIIKAVVCPKPNRSTGRFCNRIPGMPTRLHLLGLVAYQVGNHAAAIDYIGRAIQQNGNAARSAQQSGVGLSGVKKAARGDWQLSSASLNLQPNDAKIWMTLGLALKDHGTVRSSGRCLSSSIAIATRYGRGTRQSWQCLERDWGEREEAIACYQRVLGTETKYRSGSLQLGNRPAGTRADRWRRWNAISEAIELKPDYAEAYGSSGKRSSEGSGATR